MDKYCERCYLQDAKPCMECSVCNPGHRNFRPATTPTFTNADCIRGMSDEEMVKFLQEPFCDRRTGKECKETFCGDCDACMLDWLRQPAEIDRSTQMIAEGT